MLERLENCRKGAELGDEGLLSAIPSILTNGAARWFRTLTLETPSWLDFRKAFRHQYVAEYDREDLLDDLQRRAQTKGEKIVAYLTNFNYIVSRYKRRPSEKQLVETAYRNILPEYRKAMSDKLVETLEDLKRYGRRWERQKELGSRYAPSPPA